MNTALNFGTRLVTSSTRSSVGAVGAWLYISSVPARVVDTELFRCMKRVVRCGGILETEGESKVTVCPCFWCATLFDPVSGLLFPLSASMGEETVTEWTCVEDPPVLPAEEYPLGILLSRLEYIFHPSGGCAVAMVTILARPVVSVFA